MKEVNILLPPPNVSGSLHIGHALNHFLSDYFLKKYTITGNNSKLWAGYDHGGISTQISAAKYYNKVLASFEEVKSFANICKENINNQFKIFEIDIQSEEQYTFNDEYVDLVQNAFIELYNRKYIYQDTRIVSYDTKIGTAISDIEIEYKEEESNLYYLEYECDNDILLVATTRPETCIADVALCVNPNDKRYQKYIGQKALIPLSKREIPIIADDYVDINFGTGILKITPAHDINDYKLAEKHNLPKISCINKLGLIDIKEIYNESIKHLDQLSILEARKIFSYNKIEKIKSSIPYHAKNNHKIEYLLEAHWFIDLKEAAQLARQNAPEIYPEVWRNLYDSWCSDIKPWCISRTIPWGQKIPVWYKENEIKVSITADNTWIQTNQVFDTWFSSAFWHLAHNKTIDLIVTGYDILFFWIIRMNMLSLLLYNRVAVPYIYIHKLVRDIHNKKMSKVLGNGIDPTEVIKNTRCTILRITLLKKIKNNENICFSEKDLELSRNFETKWKNLSYFIENFKNKSEIEIDNDISRYFYNKTQQLINNYYHNIFEVNVFNVINLVYEVCDWLVEFVKADPRLYIVLYNIWKRLSFLLYPIITNIKYEICEAKDIIIIDTCDIIAAINFSRSTGASFISDNINDKYFSTFKIPCIKSETNIIYLNYNFYIDTSNINIYNKYLAQKNEITKVMSTFNDNTPEHIKQKANSDLNHINQIISLFLI